MKITEKSAEAIVGLGNEPSPKRRRTHRKAEGPNGTLLKIRQGGLNFEFSSPTLNYSKGLKVKRALG